MMILLVISMIIIMIITIMIMIIHCATNPPFIFGGPKQPPIYRERERISDII